MHVAALSGIVENGQIRLLENVRLPENTMVYVVIPGIEVQPPSRLSSPRLRHPQQAIDFQKEVVEQTADAGI